MPVSPFIRAEQQRTAERSEWQKLQEELMARRRQAQADSSWERAMSRAIPQVERPVDRYPSPDPFRGKESFAVGQTEDAQAHGFQMQRAKIEGQKELAEFAQKIRRRYRKRKVGNPYARKFWAMATAVPVDQTQADRVLSNMRDLFVRTPTKFRTKEMEDMLRAYAPEKVGTKIGHQTELAAAGHQAKLAVAGGVENRRQQTAHESAKSRIGRRMAKLKEEASCEFVVYSPHDPDPSIRSQKTIPKYVQSLGGQAGEYGGSPGYWLPASPATGLKKRTFFPQ